MAGRSVQPDSERIRSLRIERGWRIEDLARKAGYSLRSIQNAEAGKRIDLTTLTVIAEALGVQPKELLKTEVREEKRDMVVVLSGDDKDKAATLAELLRLMLQAKGEITVKLVMEGSVIVTLEMNEADLLQMIELIPAFKEHARAAIAGTLEGHAYFSGENSQGLDLSKVEQLLEVIEQVQGFWFPTDAGVNIDEKTMRGFQALRDQVERSERNLAELNKMLEQFRGLDQGDLEIITAILERSKKRLAATEQGRPQVDLGSYQGEDIEVPPEIMEPMEPPVPEHKLAHPDENEDK